MEINVYVIDAFTFAAFELDAPSAQTSKTSSARR